jgi:hypothetical protein
MVLMFSLKWTSALEQISMHWRAVSHSSRSLKRSACSSSEVIAVFDFVTNRSIMSFIYPSNFADVRIRLFLHSCRPSLVSLSGRASGSRGAATAFRHKLNLINVTGQLGADLETLLRAQPLLLYESQFSRIRAGLCYSMSKYGFELFIDALKMILKIISGSFYKLSVSFEAFGGDGGFATDQDKKRVKAVLACTGIQRLTGLHR